MKLKHYFISNSSTSSFILIFDKKPETVDEIQHLLFDKKRVYKKECPDQSCIACKVFNDIKNQQATFERIVHEFQYICDDIDFNDFKINNETDWETYSLAVRNQATIDANDFYKNDKFYAVVEYNDNNGQIEAFIESENIFDQIPHIKINKR